MSGPITALPADQRPRERLLALGGQALTDAELLAVLLRNGKAGQSVLDLATELLIDHGGLGRLAQARPEELVRRSGIGITKAAGLIAAFHLSTRARTPEQGLTKLRGPEDIAAAARSLFVGVQRERLMLFVCDSRDRIRKTIQVADGCLDQVIMPTREILNAVLRNDGRGFALVHNHPSGDPDPSRADEQATFALLSAASTVGLRFFDHVVVAGSRWASITSDERGG